MRIKIQSSFLDKLDKNKKRSAFDDAVLDEEDSLDNMSTGMFCLSILSSLLVIVYLFFN